MIKKITCNDVVGFDSTSLMILVFFLLIINNLINE